MVTVRSNIMNFNGKETLVEDGRNKKDILKTAVSMLITLYGKTLFAERKDQPPDHDLASLGTAAVPGCKAQIVGFYDMFWVVSWRCPNNILTKSDLNICNFDVASDSLWRVLLLLLLLPLMLLLLLLLLRPPSLLLQSFLGHKIRTLF